MTMNLLTVLPASQLRGKQRVSLRAVGRSRGLCAARSCGGRKPTSSAGLGAAVGCSAVEFDDPSRSLIWGDGFLYSLT